MELESLISPLKNTICRTCLSESDTMYMCIQDLIEYEMNQIKLIDILVFLNCVQNNDEENWPQGMCSTCVSTTLEAYNFKLNCLKANDTLAQIFTTQSSSNNLQRSDINAVYQDHEYDAPVILHNPLEIESIVSSKKELTPLPPVTEITAIERPSRKDGESNPCTVCKTSSKIHGLQNQTSEQSNEQRRYLCSICGKSFHRSNGLSQHSLTHKEFLKFKCGFCNKRYRSHQSLKEHFRVAHSNNRKLFECSTCSKTFTAKSTLTKHLQIHNGEKQYACPDCPKTFTRATYLRNHRFVHLDQERPKPFHCNNCDRRFYTKHSLLVHIAHAHTQERAHKCEICSKGFATIYGLKMHMEQHSNKDICCNICEKKFLTKRALTKHIKTHDANTTDMAMEVVADNDYFGQVE